MTIDLKSLPPLDEVDVALAELSAAVAVLQDMQARGVDDSGKRPTPSVGDWTAADIRYQDARARLAGARRRLARRRAIAAKGRR